MSVTNNGIVVVLGLVTCLMACKQEHIVPLTPLPLDEVNRLPTKIIFYDSSTEKSCYTISYSPEGDISTINEYLYSGNRTQQPDSSHYNFCYQKKQFIGYSGHHYGTSVNETQYAFEYDSIERLVKVGSAKEEVFKIEVDSSLFDMQLVLNRYDVFWKDTIKVKSSLLTPYRKEVYANQFFLYSYEMFGQLLTINRVVKEEVYFSTKKNELPLPFKLLIHAFLNQENTLPLCPAPLFFFDPINTLLFDKFLLRYKGENYVYTFDNFDRIKTIKHTTNSAVNEMQFYY